MDLKERLHIASALHAIFWGALICIIDININTFDLANDLIGMVMITVGVFKLGRVWVDDRYAQAMFFVKMMAIVGCIGMAFDQLMLINDPYLLPPVLQIIGSTLLNVAKVAAATIFCVAMHWLSIAMNLKEPARSWNMTKKLFFVIYLIPSVIGSVMGIMFGLAGEPLNFQTNGFGFLALPFLIIGFAPLIHFLRSTHQMRKEARMMLYS